MQGGLHIFRGPSFALSRPNTAKKGNAAIHGIQSVTVAAIAYIACILRFVLSSQTSFSSGTNSNGDFASEDFYNLIIRTFSHMDDEDQDGLLIWWNERLYAGMLKTDGITNGDGTSAVELLEAQIIQKRLDRKAAADLKAAEEAEAQKQQEAEAAAAAAAGPVVAAA